VFYRYYFFDQFEFETRYVGLPIEKRRTYTIVKIFPEIYADRKYNFNYL